MTPEILDLKPAADTLLKAVPSISPSPNEIQLLYSVLSTISDGVALVDRQGDLLLANTAMHRMIEIDRNEVAPERWPETYGLFLPDTTTPFPAAQFPLLRALQGEASLDVELYVRNPRVPEGLWINAVGRPLLNEEGLLWGGSVIFREITEYRRLEQEILDISGREQRRIGQDLHDSVCQILTGIKFMCSASLRKMRDRSTPEAGDWFAIQKLVSKALREADNVAKGLYPVELEVNGLVAALRELATQTRRLYGISCVFVCDTPVTIQDHEVAIHLYRIVQEAIANAFKHGQAKNITIWLVPSEHRYSLIVKNDGLLFAEVPLRKGMGWRIMNYRADMIGAKLRFEQTPGSGCVLTCDFQDRTPTRHLFQRLDG